MSYTALYRKFRPSTFEEVKGQDHIVTTLKNQIKADRLGHAYLFCGTRGTGKTSIAKLFAKAVNCENPIDGSPCGQCDTCKAIAKGASMNVIEIDAASNNGVDNIREIVDEVSYSPTTGKYKVYIIDEVHMLSIGAFNALLKTLEEPPSYVIFILATTEVHKIPITILSRCQRYDFKRISIDTIAGRLGELMGLEQINVEDKALRYVAKTADGSMRDALSLLDQCIAFHYGETLTYEMALDVLGAVDTEIFSKLLRLIVHQEVLGCIQLLEEMVIQGRELTQFVTDFTWYLRNLLLVKASDQMEDIIDMAGENLSRIKEEAQMLEDPIVMRYIRIFSDLANQIKYASQKRILIEMTLVKLCVPSMETVDDALLDRIRVVEEKLEKGIVVNTVVPSSGVMEAPIKKAELPKALPEDVQSVVNNWESIVNQISMPVKNYLSKAIVTLGAGDKLSLAYVDGLEYQSMMNPERKTKIEQVISDVIGKEISILIEKKESERELLESSPNILEMVSYQVEEDDEDPDVF